MVVLAGVWPLAGSGLSAEFSRSVTETELAPGESTTVSISMDVGDETNPEVVEEFSPAFANVTILNISPLPMIQASQDDSSGLIIVWEGIDTDAVSVTYEVTVPESATIGMTFTIAGAGTTNEITVMNVDKITSADNTADSAEADSSDSVAAADIGEATTDQADDSKVSGSVIPAVAIALFIIICLSTLLYWGSY